MGETAMPQKNKIKYHTGRKKIMEILKDTSPSDFDGHTEFSSLSPEQKLMWLSQSARFFWEMKKGQ